MSRVVSQCALAIGVVGLGVVLAWAASQVKEDEIAQATSPPGAAQASGPSAAFPALPTFHAGPPSALPGSAQPAPATAGQPTAAGLAAVAITVTSPHNLQVGEQNELVVGVGAGADVGEVSFTIRFDPNVLQARAGTEGDWSMAGAGPDGRFAAEISEAADRVQIRSAVAGGRARVAGGIVALVQFQAVAPGTTSVMIADVTVKDLAGNSRPVLLSTSKLQVTAESSLPPSPEAPRSHGVVPVEAPATETVDGD